MADLADDLQSKVPRVLKWCFAGMGAAAGWFYAAQDGTAIPLSYIVAGAASGYVLIALLFAGLRLLKMFGIACACLIVINYAVLIPFGKGDHMPGWINDGKTTLRWLNPLPLVRRWGKDVELRPPDR